MANVTFDADAAERIDAMYRTPDVTGQRLKVLEILGLRQGETVVDVGCGTGLLAYDLAATVGADGRVIGCDPAPAMLAVAQERCAGLAQVDLLVGDALALPVPDAVADVAVSTQVYEYVAETDAAMAQIWRILRPGGRLSILDTAWDSVVWHADDPALTARVLKAWEAHCPHPNLPPLLGPKLRAMGFEVTRFDLVPLFNPSYTPHSYSAVMLDLIAMFAGAHPDVGEADAQRWHAQMLDVAQRGDWFFSLNRYVVSAVKR